MITIVDYGAGNLTSVRLAFEHLGATSVITSDRALIFSAERVVLPGVGAILSSMRRLADMKLLDALREAAESGAPFLGICLGMQIIFDRSEEDGGVNGLGLLPGAVKSFERGKAEPRAKIPQIGWNSVEIKRAHPLLDGIENKSEFYFVHGYYAAPADSRDTIAETDYAGTRFASIAGRGNIVATQFHPERSGRLGLRLLENFCRWDGKA